MLKRIVKKRAQKQRLRYVRCMAKYRAKGAGGLKRKAKKLSNRSASKMQGKTSPKKITYLRM